ncbi:MAG TPA: exodeoxyribonuclease VII large subunit [Polyangiaceae bacterium]
MEEKAEEAIGVAELARRLRRAVEGITGKEWVEGEVASLRIAASGHLYFCLKDEREDAMIDCVMYRTQALRARRHLLDGARVQLFGRATVWAPRGRLQLVAEAARPAGRGALLAALEALKEKLRAEGLFLPGRKRPLPREPRVVGVVTSAHGAAIHDIVTVAFRRGGVRILLSPALVQGDGAAASIVLAIDRLEQVRELDVLVIGRGGGSSDDLMAFNDERVVRRVARARVPVVSAVGHEIDTTLTDAVADVRAATPSEAAELVVPDSVARVEALSRAETALIRAMHSRLLEDEHVVSRLRAKIGDPRFLIAEKQQYLDDLSIRLERRALRETAQRRAALESLRQRLSARHPRAVVAEARARLGPIRARLGAAAELRVEAARGALGEVIAGLDALSPLAVLSRGYAIATTSEGRAVRSASEVEAGDELSIRLHEGRLDVAVRSTQEGTP